MATPFFKNAPSNVVFLGGDPEILLQQVETVELGVFGDRGLADRLNNSLINREIGVLGLPIEKKVLDFWDLQTASGRNDIRYLGLQCPNLT